MTENSTRKTITGPQIWPTNDCKENVPERLEKLADEYWDVWTMDISRFSDGTETVTVFHTRDESPDGYSRTREILIDEWDEPHPIHHRADAGVSFDDVPNEAIEKLGLPRKAEESLKS